jgi:hypothetical protein
MPFIMKMLILTTENLESVSTGHQQEIEPLRDVNEHTTGREYYGRTSNFALLGQLFAHARSNVSMEENTLSHRSPSHCHKSISGKSDQTQSPAIDSHTSMRSPLGTDRLSIVNLLYDDETSVAGPGPRLPLIAYDSRGNQDLPCPAGNSSGNIETDASTLSW